MKTAALLLGLGLAASSALAENPVLTEFAQQKHRQTVDLAARLHLDVPAEATEFFKAAEAGDWIATSNCFERIRPSAGPAVPSLQNTLFIPIHETFGACDEFRRWDPAMRQLFADSILHSLPAGGIFFAGSGSGRFLVTAFRDVAKSPDILVVPQKMLADSIYRDYLRLVYGDRLSWPAETNIHAAVASAFQPGPHQQLIMTTIEIVSEMVFRNNGAGHEFYVQEGMVITWMYPYLEPHGLILKLDKEPLARLDPAVVARDREFWDALTKKMLADPRFLGDDWARKAYAKLRSAIGGVYAYRHLTQDAEAAYRQAIELCPAHPEANFRLAQLYVELGRFDDALAVLDRLQKLDPLEGKIDEAVQQVRALKRQAKAKPEGQ